MSIKHFVSSPSITDLEVSAVTDVMKSGWITQGQRVKEFEEKFAREIGTRYATMCSSGTSALHLALAALDIGPGDEVLVPDLTYVATANAVMYVGARPILVDVDVSTWNISLEDARKKLSERTKAIIPVHLYGTPCDMDEMANFAEEFQLTIVEDACEAIGGSWKTGRCGVFGRCSVFSFYGNKVITTGEGGAVLTDDLSLNERLAFLRGQAQSPTSRFFHTEVGFNYRMTNVQAAIGIAQLSRLGDLLQARHEVCDVYREELAQTLTLQSGYHGIVAPWLFTGLMERPYSEIHEEMVRRGIEVRPAFVPMHKLPMYFDNDDNYPVACHIERYAISLPTHPNMTKEDAMEVATTLKQVLKEV